MTATETVPVASIQSTPSAVKTTAGHAVPLAMQSLCVTGTVLPAGAELKVVHTFRCAVEEPIEVVYAAMLPRDAVLRRFTIEGEKFKVESELKSRDEARRVYEEGIEAGHLSALMESHVDGLTNLTVGQVRPGETVTVTLEVVAAVEHRPDGFRFRYPLTVAPSYHPDMKATIDAAGLCRIDLPGIDPGLVLPVWSSDPSLMHRVFMDVSVEAGVSEGTAVISSPSHRIALSVGADGVCHLLPSADGQLEAAPNRDLVIDVAAQMEPVVFDGGDATGAGPRWLAVIPPRAAAASLGAPLDESGNPTGEMARRRVCLVLDRSGSMGGTKMEQAKRALNAILDDLAPTDTFAILAFDTTVDTFAGPKQGMASGGADRDRARSWLARIQPRGGTEILQALQESGRLLGGQGDVLIVTDGEVSDTGPIVEKVAEMGIRVHCLGIDSASQDRFLHALSKRTNGTCTMVGPRETGNIVESALRIFRGARKPIAVNETLVVLGKDGSSIRIDVPTVWPSEPLVVFGPEGSAAPAGLAFVHHEDRPLKMALRSAPPGLPGLLWAGRRISVLESRYDVADRSVQPTIWKELLKVSLAFGVASRAASLVAVVSREGDRAGTMPQQQVAVAGLPEDLDPAAYGFEPNVLFSPQMSAVPASPAPAGGSYRHAELFSQSSPNILGKVFDRLRGASEPTMARQRRATADANVALFDRPEAAAPPRALVNDATRDALFSRVRLQSGLDGDVVRSLLLLLLALEDPTRNGTVIRKLRLFLNKSLESLAGNERALVERALARNALGHIRGLDQVRELLGRPNPPTWGEIRLLWV
jgi:Ca-activated chloride channel homolog